MRANGPPYLALALLVAFILANHAHDAFAPDDFAVRADFLY
jgi:hypothetical protein